MGLSKHLVLAVFSVSLVFVSQVARCYVKWRTNTVSTLWLTLLGGWAVALGAFGAACVALAATNEQKDAPEPAPALAALCEGLPMLSFWVFLVLDVLYQAKKALDKPISLSYLVRFISWLMRLTSYAGLVTQSLSITLGSLTFWTALATQGLLVGLGLWQNDSVPISSLGGVLSISYLNIVAIVCYALSYIRDSRPDRLLWLWLLTGLVAFGSSLSLGIAAFHRDEEGYSLAQCLVGHAVLAVRSYRDLRSSNDGDDDDKDIFRGNRLQNTDEEKLSVADYRSVTESISELLPGEDLGVCGPDASRPEGSERAASTDLGREDEKSTIWTVRNKAEAVLRLLWRQITSSLHCNSDPPAGPVDGITRQTELHQIEQKIPYDPHYQPTKDETWLQRFLSAEDFRKSLQPAIERIPSIKLIRPPRHHMPAEVAVTEASLPWLSTLCPDLSTESDFLVNQTTPTDGEIRVHGIATARERAEGPFMSLAIVAISSGHHGHGLDNYYIKYTYNEALKAQLVWKILFRRIQDATPKDRRRFLQNCVLICLHALPNVVENSEIFEKDESECLEFFLRSVKERLRRPQRPDEQMYLASLLCGLLESAEGRVFSLHYLKTKLPPSPRKVLLDLLQLLGIKASSPPLSFGDIKKEDADRILARCKVFEDAKGVSVASFTRQICRYVPLGPRGI